MSAPFSELSEEDMLSSLMVLFAEALEKRYTGIRGYQTDRFRLGLGKVMLRLASVEDRFTSPSSGFANEELVLTIEYPNAFMGEYTMMQQPKNRFIVHQKTGARIKVDNDLTGDPVLRTPSLVIGYLPEHTTTNWQYWPERDYNYSDEVPVKHYPTMLDSRPAMDEWWETVAKVAITKKRLQLV